jgi:hypothetical protein
MSDHKKDGLKNEIAGKAEQELGQATKKKD